MGVETFQKLEFGKVTSERRNKYRIDRLFPKWIVKREIKTGAILTFRDLVEKIMENKKSGSSIR
jgi:hypothetical protein